MAYKQTNNPISRKTSPLRDKGDHPHPHNKPGIISEDKLDLKSGSTSMHDGEKPSPKLASGDMSFEPHDKDYENYPNPWEEPDYENPNYKPGISRKSRDLGAREDGTNTSDVPGYTKGVKNKKVKFKPKTAKDAGVVDKAGRTGSKKDERKKRRKERKAIRKDKTLGRSQKTMAKKESREKQKDNNKKEKSTSSSNSRGGMMRKSSHINTKNK